MFFKKKKKVELIFKVGDPPTAVVYVTRTLVLSRALNLERKTSDIDQKWILTALNNFKKLGTELKVHI